jgi:hypothetical protein
MKRLLLLLVCITALSCSDKDTGLRTDITGLEKYMKLPAKPESVLWEYWNSGEGDLISLGPTDYSITAVIKFSEDDYRKLRREYSDKEAKEKQFSKDFIGEWFPKSAKDFTEDKEGYITLPTWNDPKDFSLSQSLQGYLFFTKNNKVFVHMYTM